MNQPFNAENGERLTAKGEENEPLKKSATGLANASPLPMTLLNTLVVHVARLMDAVICALYLAESPMADSGSQQAEPHRNWEQAPTLLMRALAGGPWNNNNSQLRMQAPLDSPAMQALLDQETIQSEGASIPALNEWAKTHQVRRWLYMPLLGGRSLWPPQQSAWFSSPRYEQTDLAETRAEPFGVLAVGRREHAPAFTSADIRLLSVLGEKLVLELERVRLSEQADLSRELSEALAFRDAERERIINEVSEGALVVDPTGRILAMNATGRELLGWTGLVSTSDNLGRLQEYESVQMRDAHDMPLLIDEWPMFRALRGQEFQQSEVHYFGPQGFERYLAFSGWPLRDEQGKVREVLLTFHETTSEQMARTYPDERSNFHLSITEEPLSAHSLTAILSAFTELHTKCWLIQQGRFADLMDYTQTHQPRFEREAMLLIEEVTHHSPWTFLLKAASAGVAPLFAGAIDAVVQWRQRWRGKVLENNEREARIRWEDEEAHSKRADEVLERQIREKQALLEQQIAAQQATLQLHTAQELFELEKRKKALELERQELLLQMEKKKLALQQEQLDIQLTLARMVRARAKELVHQAQPQLDASVSQAFAETIVPSLIRLVTLEEEWEVQVEAVESPPQEDTPPAASPDLAP